MKTSDYLEKFWTQAPLAWSLIRTEECKLLSQVKFKRPILEVGCGDGFVTKILFAAKNEKQKIDVGIDLDSIELSLAKKTGMYNKLFNIDIRKTPFPPASFKTVFANGVLEHIPDLDDALSEISRILTPGGQLITTSPMDSFTGLLLFCRLFESLHLSKLAKWYGRKLNNAFAHYHLMPLSRWKRLLRNSGLTLVTHKYYNSPKVVMLHDLTLPFSLGSKQLKRTTGSMVFFPEVRKYVTELISPILTKYITDDASSSEYGSIMLVAKKE